MASPDLLQRLVALPGTGQGERLPTSLRANALEPDPRGTAELLRSTATLAKYLRYRPAGAGEVGGVDDLNWASFFRLEDLEDALRREDGEVPAHLALLVAFLDLYEHPRRLLNEISERHLDFFYQEVLRFRARLAVPDRTHLILTLKPRAQPMRLLTSQAFSAGKDAAGVELVYAPVRESIIGQAKVDLLHAIRVAPDGTVLCAPVADSQDGLGEPLASDHPSWPPFGHDALPPCEIGFAVAAAVLRMKEGRRAIQVTLGLEGGGAGAPDLSGALHAFVSGERGWLGPLEVGSRWSGGGLTLSLEVPASEKQAVADYDPKVHGYAYSAAGPVVQFLARGRGVPLRGLGSCAVRSVLVSVTVTGIVGLVLEGDGGALDPKRTFQPFGSQPVAGARMLVGCAEALSKALTQLSLGIRWHDLPDLTRRYQGYEPGGIGATHFTASVTLERSDGGVTDLGRYPLFAQGAEVTLALLTAGSVAAPAASRSRLLQALDGAGTRWTRGKALKLLRASPVYVPGLRQRPVGRPGFVTLTLNHGFLHREYREQSVANLLKSVRQPPPDPPPPALSEPYTPTVEALTLSYAAASSLVDLESPTEEAFASADVAFFHADAFGQRREHAYLRRQVKFLAHTSVPLLPSHDAQGELMLGLTGAAAGDSLSLLFQVEEGSADPDLEWPELIWSVLCDDHWRPLGESLALDTTRALRGSGLVGVAVPPQATTDNSLLPGGRLWLRAAVAGGADGVSRLLMVAPNGVEVRFEDQGNAPGHLDVPLPSGAIGRPRAPPADLASVSQPFPSFGGRPAESGTGLRTRAAERLRHKGRAVTCWDFERLVLEAFPEVQRAKCLPHSRPGDWSAPGHVLVVVVPRLAGPAGPSRWLPKVPAETLQRIERFLQARTGPQTSVRARNPSYQPVRLDLKVRFRHGLAFNPYRALLEQELIGLLSPWSVGQDRSVWFGGRLLRSALLEYVERRDYVDYVTNFKLLTVVAGAPVADAPEVRPATPDAVLVSDQAHAIAEALSEEAEHA